MNELEWLSTIISPGASDLDKIFYDYNTSKKSHLLTFINPLSIKVLRTNKRYKDDLNIFNSIYADGMLMATGLNYILKKNNNNSIVVRQSFDGNSIGLDFIKLCAKYNFRIVLVGGKNNIAKKAGQVLNNNYSVNIVNTYSGYFDSKFQRSEIIEEILTSNIDVVIVGMGAGYQEEFLADLKNNNWFGLGATCGGYLDQITTSDTGIYYPIWINNYNLRWLYRIIKEPTKLIKRYLVDYRHFLMQLINLSLR